MPLIETGRTDVLERRLPAVHHGAGDRAVVGRRNLEDHRADVLGREERHRVDDVDVGRQRLVLPVGGPRPVDDLVERTLRVATKACAMRS